MDYTKTSTFDSERYRNRPTVEILAEQRELERLRRQSVLRGQSWWEFTTDNYSFSSSASWVELTGYKVKDIFPQDLDPDRNPVEPLLDNLVDRLAALVTKEFRDDFSNSFSDFLLWSQDSKIFDHGFKMKCADGREISVWVIAHSVWTDGKLRALFCQYRDIEDVISPFGAGVAIAKNAEEVDRVDLKVEKIAKWIGFVNKFWPLALVGIVSFNDGLELLINQGSRFVAIVSAPIQSAKAPNALSGQILPPSINAEKLGKAQIALKQSARASSRVGTITLATYEPGPFPGKFSPIAQASRRQDVLFGEGVSPISTSDSALIAEMTDTHMSGLSFEVDNGYIYSVPFAITIPDGRSQTFFVEMESIGLEGDDKKQEVKDEVAKLASAIKIIFED